MICTNNAEEHFKGTIACIFLPLCTCFRVTLHRPGLLVLKVLECLAGSICRSTNAQYFYFSDRQPLKCQPCFCMLTILAHNAIESAVEYCREEYFYQHKVYVEYVVESIIFIAMTNFKDTNRRCNCGNALHAIEFLFYTVADRISNRQRISHQKFASFRTRIFQQPIFHSMHILQI